MIFNCGPHGDGSSSGIDFNFDESFDPKNNILFSYSTYTNQSFAQAKAAGICSLVYDSVDNKKWDLKILQDCNIIFNKKITTNLFLVSGGGKGQNGSQSGDTYDSGGNQRYHIWAGGQGGYGGNVLLEKNKLISKNYKIQCIIGQGATTTTSNTTTTTIVKILDENNQQINNYSASEQLIDNNLNRDYGIGGCGQSYSYEQLQHEANSNIQNNNINGYLFHGNKYGAGGGGGGAGLNTTAISSGGNGGIKGGGDGGGSYSSSSNTGNYNGVSGASNTGSGGGGGATCNYAGSQYEGAGGDGGSGIIIISNYN